MSDFDFDLSGVQAAEQDFRDEIDDWTGGGAAYVGSAVEYGVYLEFGTSKMNPKPFFRPVLADARQDVAAFIDDNTNTTVRAIDSAEELVETLALAIERRVKELITQKGLIDTGTLRASIVAVRSPASLPDEDDLPSGQNIPPSAGRRAASSAISL